MSIPQSTDEQRGEEMIVLVIITLILFGGLILGGLNWPFSITDDHIAQESATKEAPNKKNGVDLTGTSVAFLGYAQGRGWEGKITKVLKKSYKIQITRVITHTESHFVLYPQPCSGNIKLDAKSVGITIEVPKDCFRGVDFSR